MTGWLLMNNGIEYRDTDLSHRLSPISLYDNLSPAILRAQAIADLLESVCLSGAVDGLRPETLFYAGQSIRLELQDAQSVLEAWQNTPEPVNQADDSKGANHE